MSVANGGEREGMKHLKKIKDVRGGGTLKEASSTLKKEVMQEGDS